MTHNLVPQLVNKGYKIRTIKVPYPEGAGTEITFSQEQKKDSLIINCVNNYSLQKSELLQIFFTASEGTHSSDGIITIENQLKEIWVPSVHSKNGLLNIGIKIPIYVIPLGINNINTIDYFDEALVTKKFRFISVFRWGWRKAPEILIQSFIKAFNIEDAELIIKTTNNEGHYFDIPRNLPNNIKIITEAIGQTELYKLYASSNVFVLPTRGEGWCLPITEAAIFGLPIITTNWGGPLDYLNQANSNLIDIEKMIEKPNIKSKNFYAQPSMDDLIDKLRDSIKNYTGARYRADKLQQELLSSWTWDDSALKMAKRL